MITPTDIEIIPRYFIVPNYEAVDSDIQYRSGPKSMTRVPDILTDRTSYHELSARERR